MIRRYDLGSRVPLRVRERLKQGSQETPKAGDPLFENVENAIIGSNQKSLEAAARAAKELRYKTLILSSTMQGKHGRRRAYMRPWQGRSGSTANPSKRRHA